MDILYTTIAISLGGIRIVLEDEDNASMALETLPALSLIFSSLRVGLSFWSLGPNYGVICFFRLFSESNLFLPFTACLFFYFFTTYY